MLESDQNEVIRFVICYFFPFEVQCLIIFIEIINTISSLRYSRVFHTIWFEK